VEGGRGKESSSVVRIWWFSKNHMYAQILILGGSTRAKHLATAVRTILPSWFDNLAESFSFKEVQFKLSFVPL